MVRQREIRQALLEGHLLLHYLPIVDLASGRVRGVEALVRWRRPGWGLVMPDDFLPAVLHTPVMRDLTHWVLDRACRDASRWPGWNVSVNVSARDVTDIHLVAHVSDLLATHGVTPERLVLELTEQAIVSDLTRATHVLGQLRKLGVGVALDDFGTGYSSLLYLRELPLTELKIDRTFVQADAARPDDTAIVDSVVRLAQSTGLLSVAEGVDTEVAANRLRALGCSAAQGYLWGPPVPAHEVDAELRWSPTSRLPRAAPIRSRTQLSEDVALLIERLLTQGASMNTIAAALNAQGLLTPAGRRWHPSSVAQAVSSLPPADPPGTRADEQ